MAKNIPVLYILGCLIKQQTSVKTEQWRIFFLCTFNDSRNLHPRNQVSARHKELRKMKLLETANFFLTFSRPNRKDVSIVYFQINV